MKTSFLKLATAVSLGCLVAAPAFAEGHKFEVTPSIGYNFYDNDRGLDDSAFVGLGFGYVINPSWTVEGWLTTGSADVDGSNAEIDVDTYRVDALYHLPEFGAWTPYIVGGVGRADFDGLADETQLNLGVGLKRDLSHSWNIRADVRGFDNIDQGSDTDDFGTDFAFQLALTYSFFGKHGAAPVAAPKPTPVKIIDTDGDGVPDTADACPNTPNGVRVNSRGCPLDTDRDGVYDYLDNRY